MSWMWTLMFGHQEDRTPTHGYAATRMPSSQKHARHPRDLAGRFAQQTVKFELVVNLKPRNRSASQYRKHCRCRG
jgi:hypothetical protein